MKREKRRRTLDFKAWQVDLTQVKNLGDDGQAVPGLPSGRLLGLRASLGLLSSLFKVEVEVVCIYICTCIYIYV